MDEDVHRHIFEPFFSNKEVGKGVASVGGCLRHRESTFRNHRGGLAPWRGNHCRLPSASAAESEGMKLWKREREP